MRWRRFFYRFVELSRRLRVLDASREPAAQLLPSDERWRHRTWTHFRYIVLEHLQVEGSHSLEDLARDPPEVLALPLSRFELKAVLESCRRRGFVVRLGSGSGALAPTDEWSVTAEGRRATRPAIPWFFGHAGRISRATAGAAASLVGVLGVSLTIHGGADAFTVALPAVTGLITVFWAIVWLRHRSSGAWGGRVVAEDWSRWRRERPALREMAFKRFPWKWLALSLLATTIGFVELARISDPNEPSSALVLAYTAGYFSMFPVLLWRYRWNQIESSGRNRRAELLVEEAVREMSAREIDEMEKAVAAATAGASPTEDVG